MAKPSMTGGDTGAGLRKKNDGPRVNGMINCPEVRLITETGDNIGVVTTQDAMNRAKSVSLDLVEIVPNAEPPVAKIMNFGKFKFQERKKAAEAKKKQKVIEIKEIKLRPGIESNDYLVKLRKVKEFIEDGDKVKVTLRFRGREVAHSELGMKVMERMRDDVAEVAKTEVGPRMDGRSVLMVLCPK